MKDNSWKTLVVSTAGNQQSIRLIRCCPIAVILLNNSYWSVSLTKSAARYKDSCSFYVKAFTRLRVSGSVMTHHTRLRCQCLLVWQREDGPWCKSVFGVVRARSSSSIPTRQWADLNRWRSPIRKQVNERRVWVANVPIYFFIFFISLSPALSFSFSSPSPSPPGQIDISEHTVLIQLPYSFVGGKALIGFLNVA